jgi:hypothetical protein
MEEKHASILGLMGQESGFGLIPLPFRDVWKVYESLRIEVSSFYTHLNSLLVSTSRET